MAQRRHFLVGTALSGALLTMQMAAAQAATLVPFSQFYQQTVSATLADQTIKPNSQVSDPTAFAAMRSHVTALYNGVSVKHSFLLDDHAWDCVPTAQQPAVKQLGLKTIAAPPPMPTAKGTAPAVDAFAQLAASQKTDALGNSTACESDTIPMRRVTLDDIGHFKSLHEYFQKGPGGAGQAPSSLRPSAAVLHKYAHSYQYVANLGGSSFNNLWRPYVDTNQNEIFSLSQFWYVNTTGATQTIEMGFQNYPQKYGTQNSALFIYWTTDSYSSTGCYNLDCPGFVQTNKSVYLGKGFTAYSSDGGPQYAPQVAAYLYQGNWWLYLNGGAASNAIGYYPAALFKNKPLGQNATIIDFGGEVVGSTIWPPMGSGQWANKGFSHAAYDRNIVYFPTGGGATPASLSVSQPSTSCFTDVTTNSKSNSGWGTYFYFGGPGGKTC